MAKTAVLKYAVGIGRTKKVDFINGIKAYMDRIIVFYYTVEAVLNHSPNDYNEQLQNMSGWT